MATLSAIATVAGFLSCRQVVGIQDNPQIDLTTSACGLPYGTNACASCASTNCCDESSACAADPMFCTPYESCLGTCNGDPSCRSKCTIDHSVPADNATPVSALSSCLAAKCETACGLSCGGFAGYLSMPDAAPACERCIARGSACNDSRMCGSAAECDAFWRCYLACNTPDCQMACVRDNDAGVAIFQPLYEDFATACAGPCGYGAYWACAGNVVWPASTSSVTVTEWVYDWQTNKGVADASVTVCTNCPCGAATDPPTNRVVAQKTTDPGGYYTLMFQQGLSPMEQGSSYCYETTAPGYLTDFGYSGFPRSGGTIGIEYSLLPPSAWGTVLQTPSSQMVNDEANHATYDPTRAIYVGVGIFDCLGSPVPPRGADVSINVHDDKIVPVPAIDAGADMWPTATTGIGGVGYNVGNEAVFFNVPVGDSGPTTVTLTATVPGIGPVSQVSAAVAPNVTVQVAMPPTPMP